MIILFVNFGCSIAVASLPATGYPVNGTSVQQNALFEAKEVFQGFTPPVVGNG
jgi:hypothetical protein